MMRILKRLLLGILIFIGILFVILAIYSSNPYTALEEMDTEIALLDDTGVTFHEDYDEISYKVTDPIKNIIFIPGGLVTPDSYKYLAISLAIEGYNVTITKAPFNLAILNPFIGKEFIDSSMDNVVIGHSLGGVTASNVFSGNVFVDEFILMGSYPINDLKGKEVLYITADHDEGMDPEALRDSYKHVDNATTINIDGGNHAQYGWYGPQKGDGTAEISTKTQQDLVVQLIIDFIK